jgi:spore coat protein JB
MNGLTMEQEKMLKDLQIVSFALDDVKLFLDTHPNHQEALKYFDYFTKLRTQLLADLSNTGYPVLVDNINAANGWNWINAPWPWEKED